MTSAPCSRSRGNWLYDTVESEAIEAIRLRKQLRFRPSGIASYVIERTQAEKRT
jgi:hypothetical protein